MADEIYVLVRVAIVVWFAGIVEILGVYKFVSLLYNIGIPISRTSFSISVTKLSLLIGDTVEAQEGKFKFTSSTEVLFRGKAIRQNASLQVT